MKQTPKRGPVSQASSILQSDLDARRDCLNECELSDSFAQWRFERLLDHFFSEPRRS